MRYYFFGVILFFGSNLAMDNQQDRWYLDLVKAILTLPGNIVNKFGLFPIMNNLYICHPTWLYDQKLEFLSANHQSLTIKDKQLASRVQRNPHGKWQHVENGNLHVALSFEKEPQDEVDWIYDGPNTKNMMLVAAVAHKEKLSSSQEEMSTFEHTSLLYQFPYQPVDKFVRITKELPTINITALAVAYNTNRRAVATYNTHGSDILLYDEQGIEIKRVTIAQCFIKHLILLSYKLVYALSDQGDLYAVDFLPGTKEIPQIFKNKEGQSLKIEDFAIDMRYPSQGALISNKKLYLVNVACKKFNHVQISNLNLENIGLCQLKMFNDTVGIFMRHYDQYTICTLNVSKIPSEKINAR